ncbi:hypothetical protein HDU98_004065 [Podochytrium sp. JEL0797]|nr:hypothetical protein HDU98_004065 [Podochytrium sp. JEL0797]
MDADHIAAIDNVTRRLIQDGQQPVTVGTFFSLGHSTIVIIATYDDYNNVAGYVGTIISATFLILIGTLNGYSAWCTYKEMKRIKNQQVVTPMDWQEILNNGGFFARLFGLRIFKLIDRPWKMYFVGFLFGLGFDTATEISVLAISISAHQSSDSWYILFLPALFTVGMCLIDTMDGIMMSGVYGWSNIHPIKKLFYNFFITMVSMVFALFIATVELLGLIPVDDPFFEFIGYLTDNTFKYLGIGFAVTLILTWVGASLFYKYGGYGELEKVDVTKGVEAVDLETVMEERRDGIVMVENGGGLDADLVGTEGEGIGEEVQASGIDGEFARG